MANLLKGGQKKEVLDPKLNAESDSDEDSPSKSQIENSKMEESQVEQKIPSVLNLDKLLTGKSKNPVTFGVTST